MQTPCPWDVVVVTAPTERSARAYQEELQARLPRRYRGAAGASDPLLVLSCADPAGKRVGSGGGTLNALAHTQAFLQAQGKTLAEVAVLMVHSGGDSQRSPTCSVTGKAWSTLNAQRADDGGSNTPIDLLLEQFLQLFASGVPKGSLVVASSDVLLILPSLAMDWHGQRGMVGLATSVAAELGPNHGVYVSASASAPSSPHEPASPCRPVTRYLQKASLAQLEAEGAISPEGHVLLDTGAVYLCPAVTRVLSGLPEEHALFRRCCRTGEEEALRLELYSDMLLAFSNGMGQSRADYLRTDGATDPALLQARELLWESLSPWPFSALVPPAGRFGHLGTTVELQEMMTLRMPAFTEAFRLRPRVCCLVGKAGTDDGAIVLNSILTPTGGVLLGKDAVVEHCCVQGGGRVEVGEGALVSGLYYAAAARGEAEAVVVVGPRVIVQEVRLGAMEHASLFSPSSAQPQPQPSYVVSVLSMQDGIKETYGKDERAGVWGQPWQVVLGTLQVEPEAIWPFPDKPRTLWHARLFPVVASSTDPAAGAWRWQQAWAGTGTPPSADAFAAWKSARRVSLCDILAEADPLTEFRWRRALEARVLQQQAQQEQRAQVLAALQEALWTGPSLDAEAAPTCTSLDEVWKRGTRDDCLRLLQALEEWVEAQVLPSADQATAFSVMASTFALLARLLRHLAGEKEEGEDEKEEAPPAYDPQWTQAMRRLEEGGDRQSAFGQLRALRAAWTDETGKEGGGGRGLRSAANHYEMTTFSLIKRQVASVHSAVVYEAVPPIEVGMSVLAEAPARIDLSGGWSDTPPISYELGGEVTNLAITLNGQRPIGARVAVLKEPIVVLQARQANGLLTERVCRRMADLEEEEGGCPTTLVRCCLRYCGVLPLDEASSSSSNTSRPLPINKKQQQEAASHKKNNHSHLQQPEAEVSFSSAAVVELSSLLQEHVGGGLCIETWSALPTGSGLGTSSILVGTVLAALGRACGRSYSLAALNHAVLEVEQLMGVGGGWQDQVGGWGGGAKRAFSPSGLPLQVDFEPLPLAPATKALWERHLLLVYTGRQRLARHLVRSVVRRYYAQTAEVLATIHGLVHGARKAADALTTGDVVGLGRCLNQYRRHKLTMAPSCEPPHVQRLMKGLEPRALGIALCGAGGGGFLVLVTKAPHDAQRVQAVLDHHAEDHPDAYVAALGVDDAGLRVTVAPRDGGKSGVGGA